MSSGDDVDVALTGAECQKRVDLFAEITGTDEALAQFYLQDRDWSVQRSVEDYFSTNTNELAPDQPDGKRLKQEFSKVDQFTLVTWNVDGLDDRNLRARTLNVVKTIEERQVDVVCLQEVVAKSHAIIAEELGRNYQICVGSNVGLDRLAADARAYFTVTLLRKSTVLKLSEDVLTFKGSLMGRGLARVEVNVSGHKLYLLNSHLESTKDAREERMAQLRQSFDELKKADLSSTVIFAGDLNLRDEEVASIGLPEGTKDLWVSQGERRECKYTWDMKRNCNLETNFGKFRPRCRFDRVYFRPSQRNDVRPDHFGLVGIEKVPGLQMFPSDHWGIFCIFKTA